MDVEMAGLRLECLKLALDNKPPLSSIMADGTDRNDAVVAIAQKFADFVLKMPGAA